MGLRRMPWDEWIELDNQFPDFHADKSRRIAELGGKIAQTTLEGLNGAYELLEEFRDYLPQRYPSLFVRSPVGIDNLLTGERFNTVERPLRADPMEMAARLVQDDLAILIEKPDGQYYLSGGAVTVPGTWCLEERLGMPLSHIHIDLGKVPGFKEKLERGVMNLFRRIQPDSPVQRNTWYIIGNDAIDEEGFTMGAGKTNMPVENFLFRTERQTVRRYVSLSEKMAYSNLNTLQRRLPRSGAVAFHFRTYSVPIHDIVKEPYVPGRLASAIRSWDDEMARYKGRYTFDGLLEYLDEKHDEQVANGLDLTKEDESSEFNIIPLAAADVAELWLESIHSRFFRVDDVIVRQPRQLWNMVGKPAVVAELPEESDELAGSRLVAAPRKHMLGAFRIALEHEDIRVWSTKIF
ncbi:MAG: hypothetical protein Q9201_005728 [Fulgogasparrea decipioides]